MTPPKKLDPIKELKRAVLEAEKSWQKTIDKEKNPVVKQIKQDYKDIVELENKLNYFYIMYGIEITLTYPNPKE